MGTESADWSITEFWSEYSFKSGKAVSELGVPKHYYCVNEIYIIILISYLFIIT